MKNTHITHCDSGIRSGQILLLLAKGFCKTYKAKSRYSVIFAVSSSECEVLSGKMLSISEVILWKSSWDRHNLVLI